MVRAHCPLIKLALLESAPSASSITCLSNLLLLCLCSCRSASCPHLLLCAALIKVYLQTEKRARELKQTNVAVKLVVVGKKGMTYFNRRTDQYDIAGKPWNMPALDYVSFWSVARMQPTTVGLVLTYTGQLVDVSKRAGLEAAWQPGRACI